MRQATSSSFHISGVSKITTKNTANPLTPALPAWCWALSLFLLVNRSYSIPHLRTPPPPPTQMLVMSEEGKEEKNKKKQDFCGLLGE